MTAFGSWLYVLKMKENQAKPLFGIISKGIYLRCFFSLLSSAFSCVISSSKLTTENARNSIALSLSTLKKSDLMFLRPYSYFKSGG
jgi:hypothetical protein